MDNSYLAAACTLQSVATRILRLARSAHGRHGLTSAQYSALGMLQARGPLALVDLARAERVSHPTMSRLVAGLERSGLVRRLSDPADARSRRVDLTDAGRLLYEEASAARIAVTAAILSQLKPETVANLLDVVPRVAASLEDQFRSD